MLGWPFYEEKHKDVGLPTFAFFACTKKAKIVGISVRISMLAALGSTQVIRRNPQKESE